MDILLMPIIEAETLQIIIQEEKNALKRETRPEVQKLYKMRIQEAREINKRYLTLLN
jgi:hypothetical protein